MKKINWKIITLVVVALLAFGTYSLVFADTVVPQKSALNGTVVAAGLAQVGQTVKEGQVLVNIKGIAGNTPAARANIAGKVTAVLVGPGQSVSSGQTVLELSSFK